MAKRTTGTSGGTGGEGAQPKRATATRKKAAPKRATTRRKADEEPAPKRRRPSRVAGLGTALRDGAGKILARADDEAVKAILTAGAMAAAAVILGDKAADNFKEGGDGGDGLTANTPAGRARLKAAAAAGGAAMGAQLLRTLEETRERKGLAGADDGFDPKALAAKAVAALIK